MTHAPMTMDTAILPNESRNSGVAWGPIFGGAFAAAAITLILFPLGSALGLASFDVWHASEAPAKALTAAAIIWVICVQWIASGFGGYITGRLRTKWVGAHTHEVFFRDTVHGFLSWAAASILGILIFSLGAAQFSDNALDAAQRNGMQEEMGVSDTLFRSTLPSPPQVTDQDRAEATRITIMAVGSKGNISDADRNYLAQLISARTGISEPEAQQRVTDEINRTRAAMDQARKAAATASIFASLALLVGAFIASAAGALGGRHRDLYYETGSFRNG